MLLTPSTIDFSTWLLTTYDVVGGKPKPVVVKTHFKKTIGKLTVMPAMP